MLNISLKQIWTLIFRPFEHQTSYPYTRVHNARSNGCGFILELFGHFWTTVKQDTTVIVASSTGPFDQFKRSSLPLRPFCYRWCREAWWPGDTTIRNFYQTGNYCETTFRGPFDQFKRSSLPPLCPLCYRWGREVSPEDITVGGRCKNIPFI